MLDKMEANIGAQENLLMYLIILSGETFFQKVINGEMIACATSGHEVTSDFAEVGKIVDAGATSKSIKDYELTRYACYLIVQNGDPRKEVRSAIEKIGGTMPEDLPVPEKSIQQIEKEQMKCLKDKAKKGKLMLDE
ncbi:DNA-damage-inducible protein D family protein [Eubacterium saphenum ATCC 49989]|nr:DNA-damage-inducible protein D family protein [Eubacterium saphenum ATCC 49989]